MDKAFEFYNKVRTFCRQKELFAPKDRVVVGLSGGADSVCLFLVLNELAKEWELTLFPVHVNHNLRGKEADKDQKFCEELCSRHNLELQVVSVPVAELAKAQGISLEEAGRNARYDAFAKIKEDYGCHKIAVAHHKDDQAETVLFRLFRGSRLKGLSGMAAKNGAVVRPLLHVSREEIEDFLIEKKQNYCIDSTNLEEEYTRNKIRHRIIPEAEAVCDRTVEHLADLAEYAAEVEKLLERLTEELFGQCASIDSLGNVSLKIEALTRAERILAERVVYEALGRVYGRKKDITAGFVADCLELMDKQTGKSRNLPEGVVARKSFDILWIGRENGARAFRKVVEEFPYEVFLEETGKTLKLSLVSRENLSEKIPKSTYTKWFDYDKISKVVSVKSPEAGDELIVYTDGRKKQLADVFAEAKIPREQRQRLAVLAAGNQVLWVPGIRGSEGYRVTKETKQVLIATIDGGNEDGR